MSEYIKDYLRCLCLEAKVISLIVASFMLLNFSSWGQQIDLTFWPQQSDLLVQGCLYDPEGESLDYLQNLQPGNVALVLRSNGQEKKISFKSEILPSATVREQNSIIWAASFSEEASSCVECFELTIFDKTAFSFPPKDASDHWSIQNSNGSNLSFIKTHNGENPTETFGYFMLNLPWKQVHAGQKINFTLESTKIKEEAWIMVFQDSIHRDLQGWVLPALKETETGIKQPLRVEWTHLGPGQYTEIWLDKHQLGTYQATPGNNQLTYYLSPTLRSKSSALYLKSADRIIDSLVIKRHPVPAYEVHLLAHSHVDIGFTHRQEEVMEMQWEAFEKAIELGEKTKDYPQEARFKWNTEVLWAVKGYLEQATEEEKERFIQAIREGTIGLDALFAGMLTGIQKPEELMKNTFYAHELAEKYQLTIETAMTTDIPGAQWGFVPALYHNGVKYLNTGPNHMPHMPDLGYQVGHTLKTWGDVPFYWESISGKERVLVWMSSHGYSWFHPWLLGKIRKKEGLPILKFLHELQEDGYPYEMVQLRYTLGDNAGPDPDLSDFVKTWNETYKSPKLIINTSDRLFKEFEKRYGDILPVFKGDQTPYWEDGVASSAKETALNRNTSEKLVQAEWLHAARPNLPYPKEKFNEAWKNLLLFSEHTWGSHTSKSDPDGQLAQDQWAVKESFSLKAADQTKALIHDVLENTQENIRFIDVINTQNWTREDIVRISASNFTSHALIYNDEEQLVPSQRLQSGELVFIAKDIPALGSKRYSVRPGLPTEMKPASMIPLELKSKHISLGFSKDGEIKELFHRDYPGSLIDGEDPFGFNQYWHSGVDQENIRTGKIQSFEWKEYGPVLKSITIVSEAPHTDSIVSEISLITDLDRIDITNVVYKQKVLADENTRFSFPFQVDNPQILMDHPFGVMEPGQDQLPGSNYNFYTTQRWMDWSNDRGGITWMSMDAPIVEFSDPHGQRWASDLKNRPWLDTFPKSTRLFSWIMNNVWFVNYKGYQEGAITFRYSMIPHGTRDLHQIQKSALQLHQPLIVRFLEDKSLPLVEAPFILDGSETVHLSLFKKTQDGQGWILRLFNSSPDEATAAIKWNNKKSFYNSDGSERKGDRMEVNAIKLAPWEIVTIRVE